MYICLIHIIPNGDIPKSNMRRITQNILNSNTDSITYLSDGLLVRNQFNKLSDSNLGTIIKKEYDNNITLKGRDDLIVNKTYNQTPKR